MRTFDESALFDELRDNLLGRQLRLEQKIGFGWVEKTLAELQRKF